jgi:phosphonoacetaldehyde hydrolase
LPANIKLVVFDWAGTTIDYGCMAPSGTFVAVFAQFGVTVSMAEARSPMGLHKKDHLRAMLSEAAIGQRWQAANGRQWIESDVQAMYEIVTPMQVAAAKKHSALIPGALECVKELRAKGIKIAASTGYFHEAARVIYDAGESQGYVPDFTICADDVSAGRPAPWMIFRAMEALGVYPPSAVVKVGDTVVDIQDGLNAGVWSLGVIDSSNEMGLTKEEFENLPTAERGMRRAAVRQKYERAGAHAAINTLLELPAMIESLSK